MKGKLVVGVSVLTLIITLILGAAPTAPANTLPTDPLGSLGAAIDSGISESTAGAGALQLNVAAPMSLLASGSADVNQLSDATTNGGAGSNAPRQSSLNAPRQSTQPVQGRSSSSSGQAYNGGDLPRRRSRVNEMRGSQHRAVHRTRSRAGANARTRHGNAGATANRIRAESRNRRANRHQSIAAGGSGSWDHQWALEDQEAFWSLEQCGCYVRHGRNSGDAPRHVPIWPAAVAEPQLFGGWPWMVLSALLITAGVVMSRRAD
jgi:hypothetical protein